MSATATIPRIPRTARIARRLPVRYIALESARQLANIRSLLFTFVVPVVMLLIFGGIYGSSGQVEPRTGLPWLIVTTVQMAAYGGMMSALSQAFAITIERAAGWNRQLRVTPLSGFGYLLSKMVAALLVSLVTVLLIFVVSMIVFHAQLTPLNWLLAGLGLWVGVVPFTLIAIAIGQFARPEYAQPLFVIVFLGMAVLGGLWVPLEIMPTWIGNIAQAAPSYWLNRLGQLGAAGGGDALLPVIVLAAWTAGLGALIVWRYRRDAARA